MKECNICLASKTVQYKFYNNLQLLPILIHYQKDLLMNFVTDLPILTDQKGDSQDSILIIVNLLIKMVYYKPIKVTINAPGLTEIIINMEIRHYRLSDLIVINRGSLFTLKFSLLLCYFLSIKRRLSTVFYPQMDSQTKRQNSIMEAYLQAFINFKQNNWAQFFFIAEFAYNNAKIASIGYTSFKYNCGYYSHVFYKEDLNLCSKSKTVEKLSSKLQKLINVYQQNLYHT